MKKFTLPPINVTAPRINWNFPPQISNAPVACPQLPHVDANRKQFTCPHLLYSRVKDLDHHIASLSPDADFIISQLTDDDQIKFSENIEKIRVLKQQVSESKAQADQKLIEYVNRFKLQNIYNHPSDNTEEKRLDRLSVTLSVLGEHFFYQEWENNYAKARRHEIDVKFQLAETYQRLMPTLKEAYLSKFYHNFLNFPSRSRDAAKTMLDWIGARNLHDGFLDNKVEIIISDIFLTHPGSQFGHVAINIGGVIYGRAPAAWDIRGKEAYMEKQQLGRSSIGYVIQLSEEDKIKLFRSVINKIVEDKKYSVLDHSCSIEIVKSFADIGINVVDPRWTVGTIYSPADIDNFLKHSKSVIQVNSYPKN
ncbi:hypothetical protein [Mycetohabitans rhizoxinica]|uniref:DUF4105 domain-containing protein n=1 Tax=Mycetohabitans rhizoxinica TaxID=412963 RepID=A0ABZ2PXH3_9BURK